MELYVGIQPYKYKYGPTIYIEQPDVFSRKFGFKTPTKDKSAFFINKTNKTNKTGNIVMMTVFLDAFEYQCKVEPNQFDTYYSCNIIDKYLTNECIYNVSNEMMNGIQIDNKGSNTIEIEQILIIDEEGEYGELVIDTFCFDIDEEYENDLNDSGCFDILPIENNQSYFIPFNSSIFDIQSDDENISYISVREDPVNCDLCGNNVISPLYGKVDGGRNVHINQGIINGISSWGIRSGSDNVINTLWGIQWTSKGNNNNNTSCLQYVDRLTTSCSPFQLQSDDDYINGYRVIYDDSYVYGLILYTNNNLSFSCIASNLDIYQLLIY